MRRFIRRFFTLTVVALIMIATSTLAFADNYVIRLTKASDAEITRARVCQCGNGTYNVDSISYGTWYNYKEEDCIHKEFGTDMIQRRAVTTTYKCDYCGRGYTTTTYETRRVCHGYNS